MPETPTPARAAEITEEMVERGARALLALRGYRYAYDPEEYGQDAYTVTLGAREEARACLTAALRGPAPAAEACSAALADVAAERRRQDAHPTEDGWYWYASADREYYAAGPCSSREGVIDEAVKNGLGLSEDGACRFRILEGRQDAIDLSEHVNVKQLIDGMLASIDANHGDLDVDFLGRDAWTGEQEVDLGEMVTATIHQWQAKHGVVITPHRFTATRNHEAVSVPGKAAAVIRALTETTEGGA